MIVFQNGETEASVLEGFTIAGDVGATTVGGIVFLNGSSPRVIQCTVRQTNFVGVSIRDTSSPTLTGCTIHRALVAGISCEGSTKPVFAGCVVSATSAFGGSAGVLVRERSSPRFVDCRVAGNFVTGDGRSRSAGVECRDGSTASFSRCTVIGNVGFGVLVSIDSETTLTNCVIAGNVQRTSFGGGVVCEGSGRATITNCTITANVSPAGLVVRENARATVTNSIIWEQAQGSIAVSGDALARISFSCVEGDAAPPGQGNRNQDPQFVFAGVFDFARTTSDGLPDFIVAPPDYRLRHDSPCVDAGTAAGAPGADMTGNPRPCADGVDVGAFELCDVVFRRGDANDDEKLDVSDGIFILQYLFRRGLEPRCGDAADLNDSGGIEISDAVRVFLFLFRGFIEIPAPGPGICGPDASQDALTCEASSGCP